MLLITPFFPEGLSCDPVLLSPHMLSVKWSLFLYLGCSYPLVLPFAFLPMAVGILPAVSCLMWLGHHLLCHAILTSALGRIVSGIPGCVDLFLLA